MTHSTSYRRQAKRIEAAQALEQRIKSGAANDEKLRDGFTATDREVAEQQDARDLFRAFFAGDI
jgi:hypothetical protein